MQRAATTGGGRTYRGQMPVNWYASLVLICMVGLAAHRVQPVPADPPTASSSGPPTTQQQWYAALGIDICGTIAAQPSGQHQHQAKTGLIANGNGVLTIAPKNSSESGGNATLGKFVSGYKGLELTLVDPAVPGAGRSYTNGDVCPKGTPQAGKPGVVIVESWPNFASKGKGTRAER